MTLLSRFLRLFSRKRGTAAPPSASPPLAPTVTPDVAAPEVTTPEVATPAAPTLEVAPPPPTVVPQPPPEPAAEEEAPPPVETPPAPPVAPEPSEVEQPPPEAPALPEGEEEEDNEEDGEDGPGEAEEELDDPLSGSGEPLQISLPTAETVAADREAAERLALSGPQKVTLTDPAGPGSLAETLAAMEAQGRLTSEIVDDPESGPYILYRPL